MDQCTDQEPKAQGIRLPDELRYAIYVLWLGGSSSGLITKAVPALEIDGELTRLTLPQVKNFIRRSPYAGRDQISFDQRRQFLGDLIVLRSQLAPEMKPAKFRVQQEIPTAGAQKAIPMPLYRDATCLDEILAQHFGVVGDQRAARKALRRAGQAGRDGRPQALIKQGDGVVDIGSNLFAWLLSKGLLGEPEGIDHPINGAGMIRKEMVEVFVRVHEIAALSRLGAPDFEPKVDGGDSAGVWLTEKQADAQRQIGHWRTQATAYSLMTRFFIEDAETPREEIVEEVLLAIDALAVADGRILKRVFNERWDLQAV